MISHLSCRVGMGEIRELVDGKIWEWDLSFRRQWEWDGNGNEGLKWEGIGTKNLFPHTSSLHSNKLKRHLADPIIRHLIDCREASVSR